MVKIIKAETEKLGRSRSGAKRWSMHDQKEKGEKKTHGRKVHVPKGGRSVGGMVVFGCWGLQLRSRLEERGGNFPLYFYKAVEVRRSVVRTPSNGHPKFPARARTPCRVLRKAES